MKAENCKNEEITNLEVRNSMTTPITGETFTLPELELHPTSEAE